MKISTELNQLGSQIDPTIILEMLNYYKRTKLKEGQLESSFQQLKISQSKVNLLSHLLKGKSLSGANDSKALEDITSAMIRVTRRTFPSQLEKRVESFKERLKLAGENGDMDGAWKQVELIVNECQLNAGVFYMDETNPFNANESSVKSEYQDSCSEFICDNNPGIPTYDKNKHGVYSKYQCFAMNTPKSTLSSIQLNNGGARRDNPIEICGKKMWEK